MVKEIAHGYLAGETVQEEQEGKQLSPAVNPLPH